MKHIFYVFVFVAGFLCSVGLLEIFKWLNIKPKPFNPLPGDHFLQVREDFQVLRYQNEVPNRSEHLTGDASPTAGELEALNSLKMAVEMRFEGKEEKAMRLFQHAIALAPRHPEVLNRYGEYLEHTRRDVVLADQMYFQALTVSPGHSEAKSNRQRTAGIVEALDERRLDELDAKRDSLSGITENNPALRRAKREAYFQHIYHSVGIEGNTMTLSQTRSILETRMAVDGKSIDEHNEILGLDLAMKYINATLVNKIGWITINDILEVHRRVLGHVDPIEGGELRQTQVYVGGHIPPGPGQLIMLMQHFEQWLNAERTQELHPVKLAALAHYKLVHIHPFTDGNGRTSRLLMNTILMRAGYPPIIIPKQQRHKYYDFLQLANDGDVRPFVRFIADCTERTLDLYLWATSDLAPQKPLLLGQHVDEYYSSPLLFNEGMSVTEEGSGHTIRVDPVP